MPPLLSAIANASRHGVLVTSAVVMERLGTASMVALDKTGTVTHGRPTLVAVRVVPGGPEDEDDLLRFAASAESASEHPLGRAIVAAARDRGLALLPASGFSAAVGSGVTASVAGRAVSVGSPASAAGSDVTAVVAIVEEEQSAGRTAIVVGLDGRPIGVLALSDRVRSEAGQAIADLRAYTDRDPVLLTGDNSRAAAELAAEVGISEVRAGLLPEDKVDTVRGLQEDGHRVLLVGDGINDAPALATADIGVAMGGVGSDLALASADVVIVRDDLGTLPAVVRLSRRARRLIVQNLIVAATVIGVLVTWDLVGDLPLPLGVAGHEGSTILVALNGLRLLRRSEWTAR
jgi:heavy metal translocating P-type ATPase